MTIASLALRAVLVVFGAWTTVFSSHAEVRIGQTAGFTGPASAGVKENTAGALLYIDGVNAKGGVNGHRIELVSLDDKFDAALAEKNARMLAADPRVLALFLSRGTPQTEAMLPILKESRIALVAPSTGAKVFHDPVNPYVFNVRASYQREAERTLQHLHAMGVTRIALLHPADSFGSDAVAGAYKGFVQAGLTPLLHAQFNRDAPAFDAIAKEIAAKEVRAVLFIGSAQAVSDGTQAIRSAGSRAQILTLSNNASQGFIKLMGANAHGTVISQVLPSERSIAIPVVKEALAFAKAGGIDAISPAMMEGFVSAKVLIEAIRRAGVQPTRERMIAALNGMHHFDVGGLEIGYSDGNHTGLEFVDLSIVDAQGILRR